MRSAFLLDLAQCIGCEACTIACRVGNELPQGVRYIQISERIRGEFPDLVGGFDNHRCYHCTDAACVNVCPSGALFQEDGLTRVNWDACTGCEYCVSSCPYDVPVMNDGVATKCDGCRDTVNAGGTPWCVETCPSDALQFGPREEIVAEAHRRVDRIRDKYPEAQVYGESQAGGLGVLVVSPEDPARMGLPAAPEVPTAAAVWQEAVKPASFFVTTLAAVGAGVLGVIARRNHLRELAHLHGDGGGEESGGEHGHGGGDGALPGGGDGPDPHGAAAAEGPGSADPVRTDDEVER